MIKLVSNKRSEKLLLFVLKKKFVIFDFVLLLLWNIAPG